MLDGPRRLHLGWTVGSSAGVPHVATPLGHDRRRDQESAGLAGRVLQGPDGRRTVEPHACGWSQQDNALALVYQVSGPSSSGAREGWKMLRLDRVQTVEVLAFEEFDGPRADYVRGGSHIPRIMAQL